MNNKPSRNNFNSNQSYEIALRAWQLRHMRQLMPQSAQNALVRALERHRNVRRLPGRTHLDVMLHLNKIRQERNKIIKRTHEGVNLINLYPTTTNFKSTREGVLLGRLLQKHKNLEKRGELFRKMYRALRLKLPTQETRNTFLYRYNDQMKKTMDAARRNAAARHIEHRMMSPHFAIGRKLMRLRVLRNLAENSNLGLKRKRNNNSTHPRNQNTNETNENYRQYLIQWYNNRNINTSKNMALSQLKNRMKRKNKK